MELYEFKNKVLGLLNVEIEKLSYALMAKALSDDYIFFDNLKSLHDNLATDHLQPIFQYYMADRKEKMQDYTPSCLGNLIARLNHIQDAKSCYDMCAGSGSLTIQAWNINPDCMFFCEEFDKRVIPFLLCNLKLRNMQGYVIHGDVLSKERFQAWRLAKGKVYSSVFELYEPPLEIKTDCCISNPPYNIKWQPPVFPQLDSRFTKYGVPPGSNANYAFVLNALSVAENSALILPNGVLESKDRHEQEIIKGLVENNNIDCIAVNPEKMFEATGVATCILTLRKTRVTTAVEMIYCFEKNYIRAERKQRGQFGGTSHTDRVYTKTINEYSSENIDNIVNFADTKKDETGFAKAVYSEGIKEKMYRLSPSVYIDFEYEEPKHRDYAEIMKDINRIRRKKNACKLVINETIARQMGFDIKLYQEDSGDMCHLMMKLCGQKFEKSDYIQFTKNKNEFVLKSNSKEEFPELLLLAFNMWKQRVMMLNNDENILLAELRDALLPDLMSGKIEI